jgi:hypothetical protein
MNWKLSAMLVAMGLLLVASPALADYPDDCLGLNEASATGCDFATTFEGCCDDAGRVVWCEEGNTFCIDCAGLENPECGWQGEFHDCGTDGSADPSGVNPLECIACDPACEPGFKCEGGECVVCVPDCEGMACGSDGCGGSCGECADGQTCSGGVCMVAGCEALGTQGCGGCPCEACVCEMDSFCCESAWDGICADECINDCGGCLPLENCGNDVCDLEEGENCSNCAEDCACEDPTVCFQSDCCTPMCDGVECGDDGCGGSCGDCDAGEFCLEGGVCGPNDGCVITGEPTCGGCACEACVCEMDPYCCETAWDGVCADQCTNDCGGCVTLENCGNNVCDMEEGENCTNCAEDCACGDPTVCFQSECCTPMCDDIECGDDGCGGDCGDCGAGMICGEEGLCEEIPLCEMGIEVMCDDVVQDDTTGYANLLDGYNCINWDESGPEVGFMFVPEVDDMITVTLQYGEETDQDILITEGDCSAFSCIDYGDLSAEFEVLAGETYYFIVDGYSGAAGAFTLSVACQSTCVPACDGMDCGPDGCGGICGECDAGEFCLEDGTCGTNDGCVATDVPFCGGCACEACVCALDPYCCETAWDGICVGECQDDCGGCGGGCDPACEPGFLCEAGECVECIPMCDGMECGDDGCGGSCGTCEGELVCKAGVCAESTGLEECLGPNEPSAVGCDLVESYEGCCDDMGRALWCDGGNTFCIDCAANNPECGWQGEFYDCGTDGSGDPSGTNPLECTPSVPCDPPCADGELCVDGMCQVCEPDCAGKQCGADGCGGSCGDCGEGFACADYVCIECTADCEGVECGDDGCGGTCGECGDFEACVEGMCEAGSCEGFCDLSGEPTPAGCYCDFECFQYEDCCDDICDACPAVEGCCAADCEGKVCGDDGCEGTCGECADGEDCVEGLCEIAGDDCIAICAAAECGMMDDCDCGACEEGFMCEANMCVEDVVDPTDVTTPEGDATTTPEEDTTGEEPEKKKDDGCSTSDSGNPFAMVLFLVAMLGLAVIRRSSTVRV